jgi:hypothetical protein
LGIIGCFAKISVNPDDRQVTAIIVIHAAFWMLFISGLALRNVLPLGWLKLIWYVLVAALIMSIAGCAVQFGPGLNSGGNWH